MKKLFLICAMVVALACVNVMLAQATIVLKFDPTDIEVPVCTIFEVDLLADISEADAILGWGLDLLYDNTQMSLEYLTIGSDWNQTTGGLDGDGLGGLSTYAPSPISGENILLATLGFHCLDAGFSTLYLDVTSSDLTEGFMKSDMTFVTNWTSTPANITQTPEPATLFLVGTGLAGLVAARRRKKKF